MGFSGWPPEAVEFFRGLEEDNTKAYWHARKAFYEESVREPMALLLDELSDEFGPGRIARPYRDIRFAADKSPYKTEIYATTQGGGYVRLSGDGLMAATGYYGMSSAQIERYRRAVDQDLPGGELVSLVAQLRSGDITVGGTETLKSAPRGYAKDHPRIELLRYKGLICWHQWAPAAWLSTPKAKDRVAGFWRAAAPLHDWLDQHVGHDQG